MVIYWILIGRIWEYLSNPNFSIDALHLPCYAIESSRVEKNLLHLFFSLSSNIFQYETILTVVSLIIIYSFRSDRRAFISSFDPSFFKFWTQASSSFMLLCCTVRFQDGYPMLNIPFIYFEKFSVFLNCKSGTTC